MHQIPKLEVKQYVQLTVDERDELEDLSLEHDTSPALLCRALVKWALPFLDSEVTLIEQIEYEKTQSIQRRSNAARQAVEQRWDRHRNRVGTSRSSTTENEQGE